MADQHRITAWLAWRMRPPLHFTPLRGEDKYPHMLFAFRLIVPSFHGNQYLSNKINRQLLCSIKTN